MQLPTHESYVEALRSAGFSDVTLEWTDMTDSWAGFVSERLAAWEATQSRTLRLHGQDLYDARLHFFTSMQTLFRGGNLGGCRIAARL